jgi:hypothetical protein
LARAGDHHEFYADVGFWGGSFRLHSKSQDDFRKVGSPFSLAEMIVVLMPPVNLQVEPVAKTSEGNNQPAQRRRPSEPSPMNFSHKTLGTTQPHLRLFGQEKQTKFNIQSELQIRDMP